MECNHIIFEHSSVVDLRSEKYLLCYAGIYNTDIFNGDDAIYEYSTLTRTINYKFSYQYGEYTVYFRKSDYDKTHFYVGNKRKLTLYLYKLPIINSGGAEKKATFIMKEQYMNILKRAINEFNFNICFKCKLTECQTRIVSKEPIFDINLSEDLFNI